MINLQARWLDLRQLDELAAQDTLVHRLHPCAKLLTTAVFITVVASFSKYEVLGLLPLFLYPIALLSLANLPYAVLLKRVLLAMPFVFFVGIFNPLFDQTPFLQIGPLLLSGGWISFISILLRFFLAVSAALLLIATTGMDGIGAALLRLKVPRVFVVQLLFMYRYLYVLLEEVSRTLLAHSLRSFRGSGLRFRVWGSLLGQLLLRTIDRAQRIYQAMLCRGFDGEIRLLRHQPFALGDWVYLCGWVFFFFVVRSYNIPQWLGALLMGR